MESWSGKLDKLIADIVQRDPLLGEELSAARKAPELLEEAKEIAAVLPTRRGGGAATGDGGTLESFTAGPALETIVLRVGRPVLSIFHDQATMAITDPESEVWRSKLDVAKGVLTPAIQSVGRIDIAHHPFFEWVGTAWLIDDGIAVTNRHVAEIFARWDGRKFVFRQGIDRQPTLASIDLLKEIANEEEFRLKVRRILYIEPEPGPDIAFLELEPLDGLPVPPPITLAGQMATAALDVAVIGYPAKDSRIPDLALMEKIFGDVYDKKRLAPGQVTRVMDDKLFHDCSTLGGCSGAAVIDMSTGAAVGLHFAGRFLESNFAVPAAVLGKKLQEVKSGRVRISMGDGIGNGQSPGQGVDQSSGLGADWGQAGGAAAATDVSAGAGSARVVYTDEDEENDFSREARPEDYADRKGYDAFFLGEDIEVPLPAPSGEKEKRNILTYNNNGQTDHILRYEHFSVVMNSSRRLCFFSAVNVDGRVTRKVQRVGWKMDPRIPREAQIIRECYGSPPKFSRGHMTRREDPVWGREIDAMRGNADSMCVTNTVPQMQSFNAPVWLALEDYALSHAREDKMRICVFTGPVFRADDEVRYGVKIPVEFWKVIAFIHDETGRLSATGYMISQQTHLPEAEFVYGSFGTAQVSIHTIEAKTGLSFGHLAAADPMKDELEAPQLLLLDSSRIRY